ncbi:unnamed protein product [Adineta steineri]|uniref:Uncharacterized protein n=1 Tax=Adineta steineri TaxID=433720 RepID=A0A814W7T5_9BILA|nr:unnamed protein product [Adineta steineri]CAF1466685.1 unnamed protein product [Adineta steineri]
MEPAISVPDCSTWVHLDQVKIENELIEFNEITTNKIKLLVQKLMDTINHDRASSYYAPASNHTSTSSYGTASNYTATSYYAPTQMI